MFDTEQKPFNIIDESIRGKFMRGGKEQEDFEMGYYTFWLYGTGFLIFLYFMGCVH